MAEKEKKLFVRQTEKPQNGDLWYTLKKYGGYSPCISGNPAAWVGSDLANCVGYAWSRFAYLEGNKDCKVGCMVGNDYPSDAWAWYGNSKAQGYEVGSEPKLGAVAVWKRSGCKGHVAIVENVEENGEWDSSESGLNTSPVWFTRHYDAKSTRTGYNFIGFVYPIYEFVTEMPQPTPEPKFKVGDEVIINGNLYKSANAAKPSGSVKNKKTKIALYAEGTMHPYNTTGYLGWMNEEDIEFVNPEPQPQPELKKGDYVQIVAAGNSRPDGKGKTSGGIGWKRYILSIKEGMAYPYQVGVNKTTTGYYKAEALKKL